MFIRIERNHLVEALGKALAVSGAKGNVWIDAVSGEAETLTLFALNDQNGMEYRTTLPGSVVKAGRAGLNARTVHDLAKRLPTGELCITRKEEGGVSVTIGSSSYSLPCMDEAARPELCELPDDFTEISGDLFGEMLSRVDPYVSRDDAAMEGITCAKLGSSGDIFHVVALDGHQLCRTELANEELAGLFAENVLIHHANLTVLRRWMTADDVQLSVTDKRLFASMADGAGVFEVLTVPRSLFAFPDVHSIIGKLDTAETRVEISREAMDATLTRMGLFSGNGVGLFFEDKGLRFCTSDDSGRGMEFLEAAVTGGIKRVAMPIKVLRTALSRFDSAKVTLTVCTVPGPCGVTGEDDPGVLVIAMPLDIADDGWSQFE